MQLKTIVRYAAIFGVKGLLTLIFGISFSFYQPALAEAPDRLLGEPPEIQTLLDSPYLSDNFKLSEKQEIKYKLYLETQKQGLLYRDFRKLSNVVGCESSFRHEGIYGDSGRAFGLAQFWEGTFYHFAEKANAQGLDYYSMDDQIKMLVWGYQNGQMSHWSCWR